MESLVIRDRYKVVQVLRVGTDFAAVRAVDIQDRDTPGRLINLYEGSLLHRYAPVYMNLDSRECPAFRAFFLEGSTLTAVFDDTVGLPIDFVFYRGDKWDWKTRLDMADRFLHEAMALTNLPPEIGCAALLSENVFPDPTEKKLRLRFLVSPMEEMNGRELALLAGDQAGKILPPRWTSQKAERRFMDQVGQGRYRTVVELYAAWKAAREEIQKEYQAWEEANLFKKAWSVVKRLFVRLVSRLRRSVG